jgi:4a-hydroxytetrahydrobiopterin dehydratase
MSTERTDTPGHSESPLLSRVEAVEMALRIPRWTLGNHEITREFVFQNFLKAIEFVNRVAALAEERNHHPDILISYNKVTLTLSTHKAGGLTEKDFLLAFRIDEVLR